MKTLTALFVTLSVLMLTTACGSGTQSSAHGAVASNNSESSGGVTPGPVAPTANWKDVTDEMNSSVNGGVMNQYPLIQINAAAETIELLIPFSFGLGLGVSPILPGGFSYAGLQGVTIGPVTLPDGSSGWAVSVPLKYLLQKHGAGLQPLGTLPNGQPLPYFPSAEVDGVAITLPAQPKYQVTLYVALKAVAVFVSIPGVKVPFGFGYNIVNKAQTRNIGYVALIPNSGTYAAGLYVAAQIPTDVALALNSLVSF